MVRGVEFSETVAGLLRGAGFAWYLRYLWTFAKPWTTSRVKARSFQTTSKAKRNAFQSFNTAASAQNHDAWPLELSEFWFDPIPCRNMTLATYERPLWQPSSIEGESFAVAASPLVGALTERPSLQHQTGCSPIVVVLYLSAHEGFLCTHRALDAIDRPFR